MSPTAVEQPNATAIKAMSAVAGLVSLGILVQAVTGGYFARKAGHKGFVDAHKGIAYLVLVLAVAAVVVAVVMWRGKKGGTVVLAESVAILVGVVIQIGIGMQIGAFTGGKHPGYLAIHIPVALLVFGLSVHLSSFVANVRRSGS